MSSSEQATIVGLDMSLTATGLALIHFGAGWPRPDVGVATIASTGRRGPTLQARSDRLRTLSTEIAQWALQAHPDLVVVESNAWGVTQRANLFDRAGLWWLTVDRITAAGVKVEEVSPTSVKSYATGYGRSKKPALVAAALRVVPHLRRVSDDEADALFLAAIGARALGHPIEGDHPLTDEQLHGFGNISWTPSLEPGQAPPN